MGARLLRTSSAVLLVAAGVGFGWLSYQLVDAWRFRLRQARLLSAARSAATPDTLVAPVPVVACDPQPARIDIPRLGVSSPVLESDDPASLRRGVGRIRGTARFGADGNVGLAGHRDSFFRGLRDIAVGDTIRIATVPKDLQYVVGWIRVVDPESVQVLDATPVPSLTLVTCYPFHWVGPAPRRFVVRAVLAHEQDVTAPSSVSHPGRLSLVRRDQAIIRR